MDDPLHIELDQLVETRLQALRGSHFHCRFAYCPSEESRDSANLGQDALVIRATPSKLAFCLCDGVGQSFFGNLAATAVSRWLVDYFWNQPVDLITADGLSQAFAEALPALSQDIDDFPIPEGTPIVFAEVLEEMRQHGSETMYVGGLVSWPDEGPGQVVLSWMGDSRIRAFDRDNEERILPDCPSSTQRWSSRRGLLGQANVVSGNTDTFGRLLLYSDGLDSLDVECSPLESLDLQSRIDLARDAAGSDDISLLEIALIESPELRNDVVSEPESVAEPEGVSQPEAQAPTPVFQLAEPLLD